MSRHEELLADAPKVASVLRDAVFFNTAQYVTDLATALREEVARAEKAEALLSVYDHAHGTGNSVPPHMVADARQIIATRKQEVPRG